MSTLFAVWTIKNQGQGTFQIFWKQVTTNYIFLWMYDSEHVYIHSSIAVLTRLRSYSEWDAPNLWSQYCMRSYPEDTWSASILLELPKHRKHLDWINMATSVFAALSAVWCRLLQFAARALVCMCCTSVSIVSPTPLLAISLRSRLSLVSVWRGAFLSCHENAT